MLKKFFATMLLAVTLILVSGQDSQAGTKTNFVAPNTLNNTFVNLTAGRGGEGYEGVVVNIRTYLSIREQPSKYAREIARIPNGTILRIHSASTQNGFYSIDCYAGFGYVHSAYVSFTGRRVDLP